MITARAQVLNLPPGRYQIATVLMAIHAPIRAHPPHKQVPRMPAPYDSEYRREYYKREKARRLKLREYLDNLPDDERELWVRWTSG